jgi:hypothetical protein
VLALCIDQVHFMTGLLDMDGMKERIAACLAYEEQVVREVCVRRPSARCITCG